jgi:hypothetical protein
MPVTADILGAVEVQRNINAVLRGSYTSTRDAINEFAINIQANAIRNITDQAAVDTGALRASIQIRFYRGEELARTVGSNLKYAASVEFGSAPHMPPLEPIKEWCRRHGLPESAAYPIALGIAKHGTPARPYLFPAFERERLHFLKYIRDEWRKLNRMTE